MSNLFHSLRNYAGLLVWALLMASLNAQGQNQRFPVQANLALIPPYSPYLADYARPEAERMVINLRLADLNRSDYQIKLSLSIEGPGVSLRTSPGYMAPAITLQGGIPLRLTGADLAEYFNPVHLDFRGISRSAFLQTGRLPEGYYQFKITALDYSRGVRVSNESVSTAWLVLNDPPFINLPTAGSRIRSADPQNVVFSWTPRHKGSPNAAFTVEYEFRLVEVYPAGRNPNDAIASGYPVYETVTDKTSLNYGPSEPMLVPGRQYAFRVKARDSENRDLFKNNGYSQVVAFTYGEECPVPTEVKAEALDSRRIRLTWKAAVNHSSFKVRYRESGKEGVSWFDEETFQATATLTSLKPGTKYEFSVRGACSSQDGPYGATDTIRTHETQANDFVCGTGVDPDQVLTSVMKSSLGVGETIKVNDFEVRLTEVTSGSDGFTGRGLVVVPFMNHVKLSVGFTNIKVNQDGHLVGGYAYVIGGKVQAVDDATREKIALLDAQIEAGFKDIDKAIDEADAYIAQAEEIVAQVTEYKEQAQQMVASAKQAIAEGKAKLAAARTDGERTSAREMITQGLTALKQAGQAISNGSLGNMFADLKEFVRVVLGDISTNATDSLTHTRSRFPSIRTGFQQAVNSVNNRQVPVYPNGNGNGPAAKVETLSAGEDKKDATADLNAIKQNPGLKLYIETIHLYHLTLRNYDRFMFIGQLSQQLLSPGVFDGLVEDIKKDSKTLTFGLATKLVQGGKEEEIKTYLREYLLTRIEANYQEHLNNK